MTCEKDLKIKELRDALYCAGCMYRPDEFQMRHNRLLIQLAEFVLEPYLKTEKDSCPDP